MHFTFRFFPLSARIWPFHCKQNLRNWKMIPLLFRSKFLCSPLTLPISDEKNGSPTIKSLVNPRSGLRYRLCKRYFNVFVRSSKIPISCVPLDCKKCKQITYRGSLKSFCPYKPLQKISHRKRWPLRSVAICSHYRVSSRKTS